MESTVSLVDVVVIYHLPATLLPKYMFSHNCFL